MVMDDGVNLVDYDYEVPSRPWKKAKPTPPPVPSSFSVIHDPPRPHSAIFCITSPLQNTALQPVEPVDAKPYFAFVENVFCG